MSPARRPVPSLRRAALRARALAKLARLAREWRQPPPPTLGRAITAAVAENA